MSDNLAEMPQYETDRQKPAVVWRIRYPEGNYYVAFLVVYEEFTNKPVEKEQLGLIHEDGPNLENALCFGRERDARQFSEAYLKRDIAWKFVPGEPGR